jgi:hypothetical protein
VSTPECTGPPGPITCGSSQTVKILPRLGPATFGAPKTSTTRCNPASMAVADFDGDQRLDTVTANLGARDFFGVCYSASLSFMKGDGTGGFVPAEDLVVTDVPRHVATGSFDQDGRPDVVVSFEETHRVQLYLPGPAGFFTSGGSVTLDGSAGALAVGDLNADGHDDVAVAKWGAVAMLLGDGAGGLTLSRTCFVPAAGSVAIGDFDGDGVADVAAAGDGSVSLIRQSGGVFCQPALPTETRPMPAISSNAVLADLDLDGKQDLIFGGGGRVTVVGGASTLSGAASNSFGTSGVYSLAVADFNGDGLKDVAVGGNALSILLNATPIASAVSMRLEATTVAWPPVANAIAYDVVRGSLNALQSSGGDFAASVEACVADDATSPFLTIAPIPAPGTGWWILARPIDLSGHGSYDFEMPGQVGTRDPELTSAPACP